MPHSDKPVICPYCNTANRSISSYCSSCGKRLPQDGPPGSPLLTFVCVVLVAILVFAVLSTKPESQAQDMERLREEIEAGNDDALPEYLNMLADCGDVDKIMALSTHEGLDYKTWKDALEKAIPRCQQPGRGEVLRMAWQARQGLDIQGVLACITNDEDQVLHWIYYQTFDELGSTYRVVRSTPIPNSLSGARVTFAGTFGSDETGWYLMVDTRRDGVYRFDLLIPRGLKHLRLVPGQDTKVMVWGVLEIESRVLARSDYCITVDCIRVDHRKR